MSEKKYFPFDPEVKDFTLTVEEKKLHVSKVVLMDASPVFREKFEEIGGTELELPGKIYSTFVLFLRCIFPMEYVMINENDIGDLLPLAHEYKVRCVLKKCEAWLVTEFKFKTVKQPSHYVSLNNNVEYFMKCLYYGVEYDLKELYDKVFQALIPYKRKRYSKNKFYKLLPAKIKIELLESRLSKIEGAGQIYKTETTPSGYFKCPADLFV